MYHMDSWTQYFEQLQRMVEMQTQKMNTLEKRINELESQTETSPQSGTTIEKIEYHFDQLKIETLEGTLNIGLSPQGLSGIEDLAIPEQPLQQQRPAAEPLVKDQILSELNHYLSEQGKTDLRHIAQQHSRKLDLAYESFILQDIQKQLPTRIDHHLKEHAKQQKGMIDENLHEHIQQKVKDEIHQSLHKFMQNQQSTEEEHR